jgi:hypothetical protein
MGRKVKKKRKEIFVDWIWKGRKCRTLKGTNLMQIDIYILRKREKGTIGNQMGNCNATQRLHAEATRAHTQSYESSLSLLTI